MPSRTVINLGSAISSFRAYRRIRIRLVMDLREGGGTQNVRI